MEKFKKWFYEFIHGHPFLLSEEVEIICETRANPKFKWMSERQIRKLIDLRIKDMYKARFPNIYKTRLPKIKWH